jgi:nickel-dependent lactate racemase
VKAGNLADGTAIRLHRLAVEASLLITIGGVRHHYFAGFGGGPKMVFPGVGGYREIQTNHARVLRRRDGRLERDPGCEPGVLAGNPVAEEIAAAADLRPPDCALCLVPGSDRSPAFAAAGPWRPAFAAAVERARGWYEVDAAQLPLGVASAGGSPSDATLIQAHKGLDAVCRFLEPGGELLFVAELAGGSGSPAMQPFLDDPQGLRRSWAPVWRVGPVRPHHAAAGRADRQPPGAPGIAPRRRRWRGASDSSRQTTRRRSWTAGGGRAGATRSR